MIYTTYFRFNLTASASRKGSLAICDGVIEVTYVCPLDNPHVEIQSLRRHGQDITVFFTPAERADFAKVIDAAREEAAEGSHRRPLHEGYGVDRD